MAKKKTGVTTKFCAAIAIGGLGVLLAIALLSAGCSRNSSEYSQYPPNTEGIFLTGIRPPAGDTNRLLRNAHYLKLMGRSELAMRELEAAYQQDPRNIKVLNALALACDQAGEFARAQKLYQEALALDVSNQALNNNLCFSYYLAGQWDKAETCFRQALTRNPRNIMARNNLGLLLCRRGRTEEARRLWEEAEGKVAAGKKIQQVMVALGGGDASHYAQLPEPAPVASAAVPQTSTPSPALSRDSTAPKVALPRPGTPLPRAPVVPPTKASTPLKLAANTGASAIPPARKPTPVAAAPQLKEPAAAVRSQKQPISPKPVTKSTPVVTQKKIAPPVAAAAPAKTPSPPPRPKRTADIDKKPAPAAAPPPPSKPGKIKLGAAPTPVRITAEQMTKSSIAITNASGGSNLGRQTWKLLTDEGFKVVSTFNHHKFRAEDTVVYYLPGSEGMARALSAKYFPKSRVAMGDKFARGADIMVLLGTDRLELADHADKSALMAAKIAAGPGSKPQKAPPAPVAARPSKPAPGKVAVHKEAAPSYLTAAELINTPIEIRNGSGAPDIAHKARAMLSEEGFNVARIGNHIDFGAEKTIIYYRPGAERTARNLSAKFFSNSRLQKTDKLHDDVAVKVLLGKDLLQRTEVMAKLDD